MHEIVLSAPGKNALSSELMAFVLHELEAAAGRPVLITGAGDAFSAGLDLKEVTSLDRAGMERFLLGLEKLVDALYTYPGPTVACINGHAIAGGCIVALACDLRVATADPAARIGLNETALGVMLPPKVFALIRRRVPKAALDRVVLGGALFAPETAHHLGLVDEIAYDAPAAARAHLARLASHPREGYARTKEALRAGVLDVTDADARRFRDEVLPTWCSAETRARLLAVLKK